MVVWHGMAWHVRVTEGLERPSFEIQPHVSVSITWRAIDWGFHREALARWRDGVERILSGERGFEVFLEKDREMREMCFGVRKEKRREGKGRKEKRIEGEGEGEGVIDRPRQK